MTRSTIIATVLVSLVAASAFAIPLTPLTSAVVPQYGQSGPIVYQVPANAATTLSRGVLPEELHDGWVFASASIYLENLNASIGSHPWALLVETRTRHTVGAAVGVHARLRNEGGGWGAASHSEVIASGSGTTIGSNIEVSPMGTGRVIGLNIQAKNGYGGVPANTWTNEGINLQSNEGVAFVDGIRYECTAATGLHFAPSSSSSRAIWIEGTHTVGIDVGANPIRMNAGTTIQLEATGAITVRYLTGRIEFRHGTRVLGWLATDASASGGRLN
jgi:hypothetical protein